MDNDIKLSVIIPVYNAEKHLRVCLNSLLDDCDQDDYEIILVDDGATDNSPSICDEYAEKNKCIKVIHKANGGLASARNAGLDVADGEYYTFIDSDDFVEKGYISYVISNLVYQSDIYAFSYYIDYTEATYSTVCKLTELNSITPDNAVRELEKNSALNVVWNKVYKRSTMQKDGGSRFQLDSEPGEDLIFNSICFAKVDRVSIINKPFYHWVRRGEDTLANKYRENLIEKNKVFIEYRNKLYFSLNMEETDADLLAQGNINYVFSCIPNMYRVGKKFPRKKRVSFYKEIIKSESVAYWISKLNDKSTLIKQFVMIYKTHSPIIMDSFYSVIMGMRNSFGNIWNKLRNRI